MIGQYKLILASGSPRRLALLQQVGLDPDYLLPSELDETPQAHELPRSLAVRLAMEKALVAQERSLAQPELKGHFILAADTVVAVGRRILPKPDVPDEALSCMRLLSGRAHRVYTGVVLITPKGAIRQRLVETRVRFKRFSNEDIEGYLATDEWRGKAGGYAIQGIASAFVVKIVGSYTNVVGLPMYETVALFEGEGVPIRTAWLHRV